MHLTVCLLRARHAEPLQAGGAGGLSYVNSLTNFISAERPQPLRCASTVRLHIVTVTGAHVAWRRSGARAKA
jgi:hypothetical protein